MNSPYRESGKEETMMKEPSKVAVFTKAGFATMCWSAMILGLGRLWDLQDSDGTHAAAVVVGVGVTTFTVTLVVYIFEPLR